ncbi:hypothetical protein L484_022233 [Morus notabilis]|uniref:Uncharacterized protein n=1 Tax=Morus notabilis TaxID=981085 RepID=W9SUP2_9ROSA|nr:hypothetical protein L484_022233 [Morus notabilis]
MPRQSLSEKKTTTSFARLVTSCEQPPPSTIVKAVEEGDSTGDGSVAHFHATISSMQSHSSRRSFATRNNLLFVRELDNNAAKKRQLGCREPWSRGDLRHDAKETIELPHSSSFTSHPNQGDHLDRHNVTGLRRSLLALIGGRDPLHLPLIQIKMIISIIIILQVSVVLINWREGSSSFTPHPNQGDHLDRHNVTGLCQSVLALIGERDPLHLPLI